MKKLFPTVIDISAQELDYIIVSGGKIGLQVKLAVLDLLNMVNGTLGDIRKV